MQISIKTMLLYPLLHYKTLRPQREQDKHYYNEIVIAFLERKYNADITRKRFPIDMYIGEPHYKSYFITLTLQGQIIVDIRIKDNRLGFYFILFYFPFIFSHSL